MLDLSVWIRTQEEWWQTLDGRRFEVELAMFFKKQGYEVQWTGKAGDQGVDIILRWDGKTIFVQCKAHKKAIVPAPVRDLYGTLLHQGGTEAWLVSTWGFTKQAEAFAKNKPIKLFSVRNLLQSSVTEKERAESR